MSHRLPSALLKDPLTAIERIRLYTSGLAYKDFASNFMIAEACLYNIQVIGEAVSKLPVEIKNQETQIPWALIKGM